jgi:hypothetical protein
MNIKQDMGDIINYMFTRQVRLFEEEFNVPPSVDGKARLVRASHILKNALGPTMPDLAELIAEAPRRQKTDGDGMAAVILALRAEASAHTLCEFMEELHNILEESQVAEVEEILLRLMRQNLEGVTATGFMRALARPLPEIADRVEKIGGMWVLGARELRAMAAEQEGEE